MKYKQHKIKPKKTGYLKKYTDFVFEKSKTSCSLEKHSWFCRERKLVLFPLLFVLSIFNFLKNIFALLRLVYFELLYFAHLRVRYIHDNLYQKNKSYKKVNDYKYTRPVRRAAILGFVVSFVLFQFMGSVWPEIFNPAHPRVAEGASDIKKWTTKADFDAGTGSGVKTGGDNDAGDANNNDNVTLSDPQKVSETKQYAYNLKRVHFPSTNVGYAVNDAGKVLKTTDAGTTWTELAGPFFSQSGVYFTSVDVGYVVGGHTVYKTTDGGASWSDISSPDMNGITIYNVYFTSVDVGYVVGMNGKIFKYESSSWTDVSPAGFTDHLYDVNFTPDGSVGVAVGANGKILRATDGNTWSEVSSGTSVSLNTIHFVDSLNGHIGGSENGSYASTYLNTSDGGLSWTLGSGGGMNVNGIHFTSSLNGFAVGRQASGWSGRVEKTTNGGASWSSVSLPSPSPGQPLNDIYFTDASNGYIVGSPTVGSYTGIIYKTTNGGTTWTNVKPAIDSDIHGVHFINSTTGFAAGYGGWVLKTTDGGTTWNALTKAGTSYINDIYFSDSDVNSGYALASGKIYKTVDGGSSWTGPTTISGGSRIHFTDSQNGYVAGSGGKIYRTTDAGANWNMTQVSGVTSDIYDINFRDASNGYAIGYNGEFIKTTDAGGTWSTASIGGQYYSIYFTDANNGYAVGYNTAKKTTNGGSTWTTMAGLSGVSGNRIIFTDANTGFIGTVSGSKIYYTTDAGDTWAYMDTTTSQVFDIALLDANNGVAVGNHGFIGKIRSVYPSPGTISNMTVNTGSNVKSDWVNILWNGSTPAGTAIKFRTRGKNDGESWPVNWDGPGGVGTNTYYTTSAGSSITTANSQWIEVELTLTSDGNNTPTLNDVSVSYDALEVPLNDSLTLTKTTGTSLKTNAGVTLGAGIAGGWTNETSIKLTASGLTCTGCSASTGMRPEVEIQPVGTVFTGTPTAGTSTSTGSGTGTFVPSAALTVGTAYHLQARSIDNEGRASNWVSYGSNVESAADFTVDTTAPPAVNTLSVPATAKTTALSWTTVTDLASGTSYYNVYRSSSNGVLGSKVSSDGAVTTGTFVESPTDGMYYYTVRAVDNAGNEQDAGNNQVSEVVDNNAPAVFTLASPPDNTWQQSASPTLSWNASSDANGLAKYQLYIDGTLSRDNILSGSTSSTPGSGLSTASHTWYVKAVDNAGNITQSDTLNIGYDNTAEVPTSLAGSSIYTTKVRATWSDESTLAPTQEYQVQRVKKYDYDANGWTKDSTWSTGDGYGAFTFPSSTALFDDSISSQIQGQTLLEPSVKYAYKIRTVDQAGNTSAWSSVVTGMTMDAVAPTNPSNITAAACNGVSNCSDTGNKGYEIKLSWTASADSGTGVTGYKVYRKADTDSVDPSNFALVGYLDVETPGSPVTTVYYDNDTNNDLSNITDTISDIPTVIKGSATTRLNDYVNYHYRVTAIDAAGNETSVITTDGIHIPDSTNYATERTVDVTTPSVPQNVVATPMGLDSSGNHQRVDLTWSASTDITSRDANVNGSGISGYKVFQCQGNFTTCSDDNNYAQLGTSVSTSYTKEGLDEFTQYFYKAVAVDEASSATITDSDNNNSVRSAGVSATTASNTVPTVPSSVTVTTKTGNPGSDSSVGHQNTISFNGSYAKNCVGGERCITGYEMYRSTDNFSSNSLKIADVSINAVGDERGITYTYVDNNSTNDAISPSISRSSGGSPTVSKSQTAHLSDATTYYYKVKAKDNTPANPDGGPFTSGLSAVATGTLHDGWDTTADATAPDTPHSVAVKDIHPNDSMVRNIITWTMITDPTRNGVGDFAKYQIYRYETLIGVGTAVLIAEKTDRGDNYHVDGISDAQKDKDYSYYVVAVDNAGTDFKYASGQVINSISNTSSHIAAVSINPGAVNPSVSGIQVASTGVSSATINWTTNQETDSLVEYRVKGSNDVIAAGKDRTQPTTNHSVSLGNLNKGAAYQYRIVSRNSLGNIDESAANTWKEFSTQDFYISDNSVSTTTSTATIRWNTNIDSDSYVEYKPEGSTEKYEVAGDAVPTKNHEVTIKSLKPNSRYTYNLRSVTSDKYIVTKNLDSFKTRDNDLDKFKITPAEANVSEQNITATTTQITWVTTVATTSWVEYGTEVGVYSMSAGDNDLNTLHAVKLQNLRPGTKYFYRVRGKDENGVELFSPESSFTAILMPEITNLRVRDFSSYTATITFDTNVETVVSLNYGKDTGYSSSVTISKAEKNHVVTLKDLDDNATYHFQASATDQFKNNVKSGDTTFSTPLDTQGPEVSELKVDVLPVSDSSETASVIISWTTDKSATTQVEYDDKGGGDKYENHTVENVTLNTSHTVLIKELNTSANYRFRIISKDKRNNLTKTKASNFITPTKEKSLLQIIIKSFEDTFSWTKNIPQFFGKIGNRLMGK